MAFEYDGAARLTAIADLTGEERSFEYDENGNTTLLRHRGPALGGQTSEAVLRRSYDAMDRLESQQENDDVPERRRYNALGAVIEYVGTSGIEIHHALDSLGRPAGHAFTIANPADGTKSQQIVRRYEYDDDYRVSAYVDATGRRTSYGYDALGRQNTVVYPDGGKARVEYDAKGNVVRAVDPNNSEILHRYDATDRLIERRSRAAKTDAATIERYEYDGAGRLLYALAPGGAVRHTYDSLSRLVAETQGDRSVRYLHDAAGNVTNVVYPGGEEVRRSYDVRNRVTAVHDKAGERIASFSYGGHDQVTAMVLGDVIDTALSYNAQQRLESIEYRRTNDHELVDGFRYQYDATGKTTHEIQSISGTSYGERYYYDDAGRAIRAQYGVQDVFDPNSTFEQETSYEHFPDGLWKRRVDVDVQRRITKEQVGTLDPGGRYEQFGKFSFDYDANGNCVRKESSNPGSCSYTYDRDNRLVKVECHDQHDQSGQTIDYFYDVLGRLVRKVVTDTSGVSTEFTYAYASSLLIEEYENGVLVRTYLYGMGATPVQLSSHQGRRTDYIYVFDGSGLASGLVQKVGPNAFAERYFRGLAGESRVIQINGVKVGLPLGPSIKSSVANSILSGTYDYLHLRDPHSGLDAVIGGMQIDAEAGALVNSGQKGNGRVRGAMNKTTNGFLNMMGRCSHGKGPTAGGATVDDRPTMRDSKASGSTGGGAAVKDGKAGSAGLNRSLWEQKWSLYGGGAGNAKSGKVPISVNHPKDVAEVKRIEAFNKGVDELVAQEQAREKPAKEKPAKEKPKKKEFVDGDYGPVAPIFQSLLPSLLPSPQQVEAQIMDNKRPLNPNQGSGPRNIDPSSPPLKRGPGEVDPTIAFIVGDLSLGGATRTIVPGGGFTDPGRPDYNQPTYSPPLGTFPNTGQPAS